MPGDSLMFSPLRIDERVLHALLGLHYVDDRLSGLVVCEPAPAVLAPSHARLAGRIAALWQTRRGAERPPAVQLIGAEPADARAIAAAASHALGGELCSIPAAALPTDGRELEALLRLWARETLLSCRALLLECDDLDASDAAHHQAVTRFVEGAADWLFLSVREPRAGRSRPLLRFEVAQPLPAEVCGQWRAALGPLGTRLNGQVERAAAQFRLAAPAIVAVASHIAPVAAGTLVDETELGDRLWDACRSHCRTRLDELARRIDTHAGWPDLVLPAL
jgi:hypothetical protein